MATEQADILAQPLRAAAGLTDARARAFSSLGVATVGDLLRHFPFRVEQEAGEDSIAAHVAMLEAKPSAERTAHIALHHIEWQLPGARPALAQGQIAGVPAKLVLDTDGSALLLVACAARRELEERLG